jgi:cysteine desulfurase/selenocysteine lyase
MDGVRAHEIELTARMLHGLMDIPEITVYGPPDAQQRCGVVAFNVFKDGELFDAHLVAELLNDEGIAVRAGGHCAYPLAQRLEIPGTVRASVYVYNAVAEIVRFLQALDEIVHQRLL